jgi:hypothetical protein
MVAQGLSISRGRVRRQRLPDILISIIVRRDVVLRALEWLKLNIHLYKDWMAVNQTPQRDTLSVEWHAVL